ncbi:hypothetical protein G7K_0605-t1 [Saitoella complicata NRRL Y-17804]|uniref:Uncharacterized protein n=1 Tax=Saitoella complicata (strain BCRC 22490 / CBS 7301 / JCM 7358 / NBRC 10748 / NRRL Y-17804) TaxID=698492 RepID=A0A0E9N988_SAICN|nr:hypothetical protein G7K_0605-t1 [Saitoella complicata NRRL Y-17804]
MGDAETDAYRAKRNGSMNKGGWKRVRINGFIVGTAIYHAGRFAMFHSDANSSPRPANDKTTNKHLLVVTNTIQLLLCRNQTTSATRRKNLRLLTTPLVMVVEAGRYPQRPSLPLASCETSRSDESTRLIRPVA